MYPTAFTHCSARTPHASSTAIECPSLKIWGSHGGRVLTARPSAEAASSGEEWGRSGTKRAPPSGGRGGPRRPSPWHRRSSPSSRASGVVGVRRERPFCMSFIYLGQVSDVTHHVWSKKRKSLGGGPPPRRPNRWETEERAHQGPVRSDAVRSLPPFSG